MKNERNKKGAKPLLKTPKIQPFQEILFSF